jgi:hypothetical protein
MAEKRPRRKWWVLGTLALLLAAGAAWNYWPADNRILIGRDTTYIDGPLNPDGTVNPQTSCS